MDYEHALTFYACDDEQERDPLQLALQTAASWRHFGPLATTALIAEARRRGLSWRDIEALSSYEHDHDGLITKIDHITARRLYVQHSRAD